MSKLGKFLDKIILPLFEYKGEKRVLPPKIFKDSSQRKFESRSKNPKTIKLKEMLSEFLKDFSGKDLEIHEVIIPFVNKEIKLDDNRIYKATYENTRMVLNELLNEGKIIAKTHVYLMVNTIQVL